MGHLMKNARPSGRVISALLAGLMLLTATSGVAQSSTSNDGKFIEEITATTLAQLRARRLASEHEQRRLYPATQTPAGPIQRQSADRMDLCRSGLSSGAQPVVTPLPVMYIEPVAVPFGAGFHASIPDAVSGAGPEAEPEMSAALTISHRPITLKLSNWTPLTRREKAMLLVQDEYSPATHLSLAANAGISWSTNGAPYMGQGWSGFGRRFGYSEADEFTGVGIQSVVLPILFHEEPRYIPLDRGRAGRRIEYALTRVFITKKDDGSSALNKSKILGEFSSAFVQNLYYPNGHDGGAGATAARSAVNLATDAGFNLFTEFWPDMARKVRLNVFFQNLLRRTINSSKLQ